VEITIADDGCGISDEARTRIFEPFFTTKPVGKGTGLGLAIARQIVRDHGGTIRLDSGLGRGTQAVIVLPTLSAVQATAGAAI
jgi:two-component system NtrC family sensor kinase